MKFIQKKYKTEKFQNILQKHFFFFQTGNLSASKWIELQQELKKVNIETNKTQNNLIKKLFKDKEYKTINNFIQGPLMLGYSKNLNYPLEKLLNPIKNLTFLSIKFNYNFYNRQEIANTFSNSKLYNQNLINELMSNSKMIYRSLKKIL